MLCDCLCVVVCVVAVVTNVSPVPSLQPSSPRLWSFCLRRVRPARPCRGHRRRLALRASRRTTTTMTTLQGEPCLPAAAAATMAAPYLPTHPLAERLKHQLHQHNIFVVLIVPTRLRRRQLRHRPPEMPLPKSAEHNLQEITHILPHFCAGIVINLRCDAVAVVALPILPHNEPRQRRSWASTSSR